MKVNFIIITVATLVLLGLGGYLIKGYGTARFDAGYDKAHSEQAEAALDSSNKEAAMLEKEMKDAKKVKPDAIDAEFAILGILREQSDR